MSSDSSFCVVVLVALLPSLYDAHSHQEDHFFGSLHQTKTTLSVVVVVVVVVNRLYRTKGIMVFHQWRGRDDLEIRDCRSVDLFIVQKDLLLCRRILRSTEDTFGGVS